jgi:CheY-like chemotaxis protein
MERVIINVVGNAIKFTPTGGAVEVSLDDDPERPRNVRLSIQDNGIGIPKEALDKVTVRYFTVGEQPTGTGLGLAISREIVMLHGGRIGIDSPPPGKDKGTLVSVSLPVTDSPLTLLVDDDEGILSILEDQVSRQGYRVLKARGGMEALELIRQHRPEVVILDLVLPDFDGTELILKMKSEKALAPITIVVLTGADISSGKAEILQSFSIPILAKPWEEAELLDHVAGAFFGGATTSRPARPDSHVMFRN